MTKLQSAIFIPQFQLSSKLEFITYGIELGSVEQAIKFQKIAQYQKVFKELEEV